MHVLRLVQLSVGRAAFPAPHSLQYMTVKHKCHILSGYNTHRSKNSFPSVNIFHLYLLARARSAARYNLDSCLFTSISTIQMKLEEPISFLGFTIFGK